MHASHLLPHLSAFRITDVALIDKRLTLDIIPRRHTASCPLCSRRTKRIHSRYVALADLLGMEASSAHLLRLLRRESPPPEEPVRVLGVDDWATRKGRTYGTILVDLERHCPIDLLPDRTSETLATWLIEHAGVEILSRDRWKDYAQGARQGARQGAPNAVQVADGWHLFKNLGDVLERVLTREHRRLRDAAAQVEEARPVDPLPEHELTRAEQEKQDRRARRIERYEMVQELKAKGLSLPAIARTTGLTWITAKKLASAPSFPERVVRRPGPVSVVPYDAYLRDRWEAGCRNAEQLWRELRDLGYRGSDQTVRRHIAAWRVVEPPLPTGTSAFQPYTPRHVAWVFMQQPDTLSTEEMGYLQHLRSDEQFAGLYSKRLVTAYKSTTTHGDHYSPSPIPPVSGPQRTSFG